MSAIYADLITRCQSLVTPGGIRHRGDKWYGYVKVLDSDGSWRQRAHALCDAGDDLDASRSVALERMVSWRDGVLIDRVALEAESLVATLQATPDSVAAQRAELRRPFGEYATGLIRAKVNAGSIERSTAKGYLTTLRAHILPALGAETAVGDIGTEHVDRVMAWLAQKGLSPSTKKKTLNLLRSTLEFAVEHHGLPNNACTGYRSPAPVPARHNELTPDLARDVMDHLAGLEQTAEVCAARLALLFGLGEGESCALTWGECDHSDHILIRNAIGTADGGTYVKVPKAPDRARSLPLTGMPAEVLRAQRERARLEWSAAGLDGPGPDDYVIGLPGRRWATPAIIGRRWKAIAEVYGWRGALGEIVTFYDLRHTFASVMLQRGVDPKTIQYMMGHATLSTTLGIYAASSSEARVSAMRTLEAAYGAEPDGTNPTDLIANLEGLLAIARSSPGLLDATRGLQEGEKGRPVQQSA